MSGPAILGTREARPQLLEVQDLHVSYGAITALRGVSLAVGQGEVVALIGANGAGKTSTLRAISGMLKPRSGRIRLAAQEIQGLKSNLLVPQGMAHAPEGRGIFLNLTVMENLFVSYGAIEALRGVSLKVETGQVVALIGANGAGKTSTLRAVSGMLRPAGGKITLGAEDITGMKAH
ncbi:MAG: ATP-binding cassette domain-containing protein, partial [Myxococcaceae bacterium]